MPVTIALSSPDALDTQAIVAQIQDAVLGVQHGIVQNAANWLAQANAQGSTLDLLAALVQNTLAKFQATLGYIAKAQADPTAGPVITSALTQINYPALALAARVAALNAAIAPALATPIVAYADVIIVSNALIATVPRPVNLWLQ